ncbi:MAG: gliding motility-associated C-terminal domain-containing protein [Saprospiraceae bacterium]
MRNFILIVILSCTYFSVWAQPTIKATRHTVPANAVVTVEITLDDFTDILATQYSINWDPAVVDFIDVMDFRQPFGMNINNIDQSQTLLGRLMVDWQTPTGLSQTIPDNSPSFKIRFRTKAAAGGLSTPIEFTDTPLAINVSRENAPGVNIGFFTSVGRISVIAPACRQRDSIALRQIYDDTDGANWTSPWDISRPINYWEGVILDNQGCLQTIDLDGQVDGVNETKTGNGLLGTLPNIQIPTLKKLYLSGNQLISNIPDFDGLPQLEELALDDNDFTLALEFSSLFVLDDLNIAGNKLSFDDILPNIGNVPNYIYAPQQEILEPTIVSRIQGDNYSIELGIDANLTENEYEWRKDGVAYRNLTGVNQLDFTNLQLADAGVYTCTITNASAPDLVLQSAPITIQVTCPPIMTDLDEEICAGSSYRIGDVNYAATGFYEQTLAAVNGCDSVVRLNLMVNDALTTNLDEIICDETSYTLGDETYTTSGDYEFTFMTATGCDSTVFLNLTIAENRTESQEITLCNGEIHRIGDDEYSVSGAYVIELPSAAGCDSIINLSLEVLPQLETNLDEQICAGTTFRVGSNTYSETGSYTADLQSVAGCDSTVYLELLVVDAIEIEVNANICSDEEYRVGEEVFTATGNYQVQLIATSGCDSLVNLNLAVAETQITDLNISRCAGESYMVGTSVYTETGTYEDVLENINGCDSIVNLNLQIQSDAPQIVDAQICEGDSYQVGTEIFTTAGNYEVELTSVAGCDSLVQLNLQVGNALQTEVAEQICTGMTYSIGTQNFTETGNYVVTIPSQSGCDSTVFLDLSVVDFVESSITELICEGENFTFGGEDYNTTGQYQTTFTTQNGCDSVVYLDLKVANEASLGIAEASGNIGTCQNSTAVFAQAPNGTIGEWSSLGVATLTASTDDLFVAENLQRGDNLFVYSLSTSDCPVFSTDTLVVNFTNPEFSVSDDNFKIEKGVSNTEIDLLANDVIENPEDVTVEILNSTNRIKFTEVATGVFQVVPDRNFKGILNLEYEVCNIPCPEICRRAALLVEIVEPGQDQPTLIITPNGDGLNETLVFDQLDEFPGHELVITNRWGGQVFMASPYQNNWDGHNASGKPLPEGTYYYLLRLDVGEGEYQVGSVTVKR